MGKIENAIKWMENKAADPSAGYDQIYRWGEKGDYDCSSAVVSAWEQAGVPVKSKGASYTGNMYDVFIACGFKNVTASVNFATGAGLQRGDVLLYHNNENGKGHTAMYCGNCIEVEASINEKGTATGGKAGDQTGMEFLQRSYRNYPWKWCLRYTETIVSNNKKSIEDVAKDVIAGKYGVGDERVNLLEKEGYNADKVQAKVNEILKASSGETQKKQETPADTEKKSSDVHPWIEIARYFNKTMKKDLSKGIVWYYSNYGCKATFKTARKNKLYKTNCARWVCWILRKDKVLNTGQSFFGNRGKIQWNSAAAEASVRAKCDIINAGKKTLSQLQREGKLRAGDVLIYTDIVHTNMVGYNGKFWDAGHAYALGSGEGAVFKNWYGGAVHAAQRVSYIIRKR